MTLVVNGSNMAKKKIPRLGIGELEVLKMLWRDGPATLSQAHESLGKPIGYTTVQTRLNRLVNKGIVRKSADRPTQYSAGVTQDQINRNDLETLVDKVNDGKFIPLISHLVSDRRLTANEIDQLKEIIADAENQSTKKGKK